MNDIVQSIGYKTVQATVHNLLSVVSADCPHSLPYSIPEPHSGSAFTEQAVAFAEASRLREVKYTPQVYEVAKDIEKLCHPGWEDNKAILALLHKTALIVENFSDHPDSTKRVAALGLSKQGKLLVTAATNIPVGIPLEFAAHDKGERRETRNCAEINGLATLLGVEAKYPALVNAHPGRAIDDYRAAAKWAVQRQRDVLNEKAADSPVLKDMRWLVSRIPCYVCAKELTRSGAGVIIAPRTGSEHFTRPSGMFFLETQSMTRVIHYPNV